MTSNWNKRNKRNECIIRIEESFKCDLDFYKHVANLKIGKILRIKEAFDLLQKEPFAVIGKVVRSFPYVQDIRKDILVKSDPATNILVKELETDGNGKYYYGKVFKCKIIGEIAIEFVSYDLNVGDLIAVSSPLVARNTDFYENPKLNHLTGIVSDDTQSLIFLHDRIRLSKKATKERKQIEQRDIKTSKYFKNSTSNRIFKKMKSHFSKHRANEDYHHPALDDLLSPIHKQQSRRKYTSTPFRRQSKTLVTSDNEAVEKHRDKILENTNLENDLEFPLSPIKKNNSNSEKNITSTLVKQATEKFLIDNDEIVVEKYKHFEPCSHNTDIGTCIKNNPNINDDHTISSVKGSRTVQNKSPINDAHNLDTNLTDKISKPCSSGTTVKKLNVHNLNFEKTTKNVNNNLDYVKINEINETHIKKSVNMFVLVLDTRIKEVEGKKKNCLILRVIDETCVKFKPFTIYVYYENERPNLGIKWILRLRHVKIEIYNEVFDGRIFNPGSIVGFPPIKLGEESENPISFGLKPYETNDFDLKSVNILRNFLIGKCWNLLVLMEGFYSTPPDSIDILNLEKITDETWFSLKCEVVNVKMYTDYGIVVVTIKDGTKSPYYIYSVPKHCTLWSEVLKAKVTYSCELDEVDIVFKNVNSSAIDFSVLQKEDIVLIKNIQIIRNKLKNEETLMFVVDAAYKENRIQVLQDMESENIINTANEEDDSFDKKISRKANEIFEALNPEDQKRCLKRKVTQDNQQPSTSNHLDDIELDHKEYGCKKKKKLFFRNSLNFDVASFSDSTSDFFNSEEHKLKKCSSNNAQVDRNISKPTTSVECGIKINNLQNTSDMESESMLVNSEPIKLTSNMEILNTVEKEVDSLINSEERVEEWLQKMDIDEPIDNKIESAAEKNIEIHHQSNNRVQYESNSTTDENCQNIVESQSQIISEFVKSNFPVEGQELQVVAEKFNKPLSFQVMLWDMSPRLSDNIYNIISGSCENSCDGNFYLYSTLKFHVDEEGKKKALCPVCFRKGKIKEVVLNFLFEILLIIPESGHSLTAIVYGDEGVKFLGCTVEEFLLNSEIRLRIINKIRHYMDSGHSFIRYSPRFSLTLISMGTNSETQSSLLRFRVINTELPSTKN